MKSNTSKLNNPTGGRAMTDKPQELTMANSPQLDKLKERDERK